ncbi:MAG: O-antigen ligase family protein [Planctomycetales bacterium]|nr:O-antigen ligase family protein [Planctomycetales bacterium]
MSGWAAPNRKKSRRASRGSESASERLAAQALAATDAGLAGVVFVAPLFLGGRHDIGRFLFAAFVALTAVSWAVHRVVSGASVGRRTLATPLFVAAAAVLVLQLVPLPAAWLSTLAPLHGELLSSWESTAAAFGLAPHRAASLSPEATRHSLAMVLAYGLLFTTACQRLRTTTDVQRLQRWLGVSVGAMAALALVQFAIPNGCYLWVYSHPTNVATNVCGAFANRNHLGQFLVLGITSLAAWTLQTRQASSGRPNPATPANRQHAHDATHVIQRAIALAPAVMFVLAVVTVLISGSRGGVVALAVAAVALAPAVWRSGQLRKTGVAGVVALIVGVVLAAIVIIPDSTADRLATVVSTELDEVDADAGRRKIWMANWEAIQHGGALGAGAGSHREIYRVFLPDPPSTEYTHAESSVLQIVTETGWVGAALLLGGVLLAGSWIVRGYRIEPTKTESLLAVGSAAAVTASLTHATFDFVWHIPACMSFALLQGASLLRLVQLSGEGSVRESNVADRYRQASPQVDGRAFRFAWQFAIVATLLSTLVVAELLGPARAAPHWDSYLRISRSQRHASAALMASTAPPTPEQLQETRRGQQAALAAMLDELTAVVRLRPQFADAHRQLANRCQQLFELRQVQSDNPMPVSEIRDAAIASQFTSSTELLGWLRTAFGEQAGLLVIADRHACAAVALSPLEGDAYLRLADLAFLHGLPETAVHAALDQAVRVRPYDGDVLLTVGAELAARGETDRALETWRRSFAIRGPHRRRIAQMVAGRMAPTAWIEWLQPGWDTLPAFWQTAAPLVDDGQRAVMLAYAQECADRDCRDYPPWAAGYAWRTLASMQRDCNQPEAAIATLRRATQANPNDVVARRALALALFEINQYDEAESHLSWCLARNPTDGSVQNHLKLIRKVRIAESITAEEATVRR